MRIVIIGAGVAGLSIAWRLLQGGAAVTLLERAQPGQGASWAAAGMLAVTAELAEAAAAERDFAMQSNGLWPDFAAEIEAESGQRVFYSRSGALILARDSPALEVLAARVGDGLELLDRDGLAARVPLLGDGFAGALWSPREAVADNRALCAALTVAVLRRGGVLSSNEAAVRIEYHGGRAVAAVTPFARYPADAILVAAGAWSGELLDTIPVIPVKGEMIALAPPSGVALPGPVVWGDGVYLVPRHDRLMVGATVQEVGFDTSLTRAARQHLRDRAENLMPDLKNWTLMDQWAGLRPRTSDGLPLLGPAAAAKLFVAGGQFRNGILFAPAIARHMADLILGRGVVMAAFDPRRFA